jgi:very-short-patch-repair endonuclease
MVPLSRWERILITGPPQTVKRARKLRSDMSLPETLLWRELRKRPGGFKFRRQHPAGIYVLDFYCASVRLAIEVDGFAHDSARAAKADEARAHFLRSQHVATLRVPAKVVLDDLEAVVTRIIVVCEEREGKMQQRRENLPVPLHHPSDGPPPRAGEDLV